MRSGGRRRTSRLGFPAAPAGCGSPHCTVVIIYSCLSQVVQQAQLLQAQSTHTWACHIKVWWLGATYLLSGGRRRKPAWPPGAPRRLRLSLLHCSSNNNMLLPQPGSAEGTALAGTAHTHMGMSYQGLVAGDNLRAEWRSEARAGLATWCPSPAAALPAAL